MLDEVVICIKNLNYSYGSLKIFKDLSFNFHRGIYALAGENGVGKTTLLNCLSGVKPVSGGKIFISTVDVASNSAVFKSLFTYVMDKLAFYPFVTGEEFLSFIFSLYQQHNRFKFDELLEVFQLKRHLGCKISNMSLGTQKKLMIVASLLLDVKCIFMDEPTNALDKESVSRLADYLNQLKNEKCILFASHDHSFIKKLNCKTLTIENFQLAS